MKKFVVGAALLALAAAPMQAQTGNQAGDPITSGHSSFYLGPYAGYMIFGDMAETSGGAEWSNEDGALFGAQAGFSINPNFSILGNVGWTKSKFTVEYPDGSSTPTSGDIGVWLYDGALQFRLPFQQRDSWIAPFGQVGAGAIRWTADTDDIDGQGETNVQFNFGVGADFQFQKTIGLRLMVKDYITSINWTNDNTISTDVQEGDTMHNWAITAGLNFGF
jgi:opacity protein-like surface antigen